jgi:TonB family protein
MLKPVLIALLSFLFVNGAAAQIAKKDTAVYYLNKEGTITFIKDSVAYYLVVIPPDTSIDKELYTVKEFYPNGKPSLMTGSKTNKLQNLKFEGSFISFYPNGHKMMICNYENGNLVGNKTEYYPNGKLYNVKNYKANKIDSLIEYRDSVGNILTDSGKGKWREYDADFKKIAAVGLVKDGQKDGIWRGAINDTVSYENRFEHGVLVYSSQVKSYKPSGEVFVKFDTQPQFKGGIQKFAKFLIHNIRYPIDARRNWVQGRVIVDFTVEPDGTLSHVRAVAGIRDGCDEEAVRVIKMSPLWQPATKDGKPVRAAFSVPVAFGFE